MSTLVRLTKMVDLAVGSPEPGAVNFNILHSLLHVIIQQVQLEHTEVEFRGDDAYRVQSFLDNAPPYPTLKLSEYTIFGDAFPPGSAGRPPTNKKRDERSRRPEDDRRPHSERHRKTSASDEQLMTVVDHVDKRAPREPEEKKKVGPRKSGALVIEKRQPSLSLLEEQVEDKHRRGDRERDDRKPRDREERPRDREERPRGDREEKSRGGKEERPRGEREERPRGEKEERPRSDREERPRGDREEKPRGDREERPRGDREERPRGDREEKPRGDREERPRGDREERPRGEREERPRGEREERSRGEREERPRGEREERPRGDKEERPRGDREERPRGDREERSRGEREERPRGEREERPRGDREERPRGDREGKPRDEREERPRGEREERPRGDREERPRGDREERPRGDREERPRGDREEKPRGEREERPRGDREEKPRGDREERPRGDREERPRGDREEKPRGDREERPRDRDERPRDRDEKSRDSRPPASRDERPKDSRRADDGRRGDDDRGKSSRREEEKPKTKVSTESRHDDTRRTTVVVIEPYDGGYTEETDDRPLMPAPIAGRVEANKSHSILKKTPSTMGGTSYQKLMRTVSELQTEVAMLSEFQMPTNQDLLDSARSHGSIAPVGEMWELLKLTKRMDGAETGINKLTSMIEDLAKESPANREAASSVTKLVKDGDDRSERIQSIEKRLWEMENRMVNTERRMSDTPGGQPHEAGAKGSAKPPPKAPSPKGSPPAPAAAEGGAPNAAAAAGGGGTKGTAAPAKAAAKPAAGAKPAAAPAPATLAPPMEKRSRSSLGSFLHHRAPIELEGLSQEQMFETLREELNSLRRDVDEQMHTIRGVTKITDNLPPAGAPAGDELRSTVAQILGVDPANVERLDIERIGEIEERVNNSALHIHTIDQNYSSQLEALQRQVADMEKELGMILERLNAGMPVGETGNQDFSGLGELYNKMTALQSDIDNVTGTATRLMDEREERQLHINALLEQIEVLKTVKADKEDLEDALADKADHNTMNRKVSHDQFDAACDDLSRGLEEALAKLSQQEMLWQQALDDVQREIETKLDKIEISPLKDFVNSKLKLLQERLKALAALRRETEAAGTKHRLLRNVNCISCDKDAVMKMDDTGHVASEPLPPNRSMRPYLTYELDAVRKQQKRLPGSRNLNHFESAVHDQQKRDKSKEKKRHMETTSADHLCNRYCGGSHTITTPQQRVTRMGHFLAEYGPEAIPLRKAQRPRALSIADKMMMTKGMMPNRLAQLAAAQSGGSGSQSPGAKSPRSSLRPGTSASVEVIKPAKQPSPTKRASQGSGGGSVHSVKAGTPPKGSTPPKGTPPKEATPPREGTPPAEEAPPPAEDGAAPPEEEAPPAEPAEEGAEVADEAVVTEEGEAPPPSDEAAPVVEEGEGEVAEPPPEVAGGEEPPPEGEPAPEAEAVAEPEAEPPAEVAEAAEAPPPAEDAEG